MRLYQKLLLLLLLFGPLTLAAQQSYPEYDTSAGQLQDIQRLVDATLPDIEAMLKQSGSFRPFASVILANDSIAEITVSDPSKTGYTPDELKEELSIDALKGVYKVVAVFYADRQADPETGKDTQVIAVFAEHTDDDFAYLFYYPFSVNARKEVIFGDSFGDFAPQVMFRAD